MYPINIERPSGFSTRQIYASLFGQRIRGALELTSLLGRNCARKFLFRSRSELNSDLALLASFLELESFIKMIEYEKKLFTSHNKQKHFTDVKIT